MAVKFCLLILLVVIFHEGVGLNRTSNGILSGLVSTRSLSKRYSAYKQKLAWPQALLFCRRRKKQLATILSEDEHQSLRSEIDRLAKMWDLNVNRFWIGGGVEGSDWVWGNSGKQLQYVIWGKGQPKPKNLCLQINANDNYNFVSGKCEDLAMFVCQN